MQMTLGYILHVSAHNHPDREAIVFPDARATFAELDKKVNKRANALLASGIKKGDHVVFQGGLYGGTQRFIDSELERYGIEKCYVHSNNVTDYNEAIQDNTKVIYVESPTNPLLGIIDLVGIAKLGKEHG